MSLNENDVFCAFFTVTMGMHIFSLTMKCYRMASRNTFCNFIAFIYISLHVIMIKTLANFACHNVMRRTVSHRFICRDVVDKPLTL